MNLKDKLRRLGPDIQRPLPNARKGLEREIHACVDGEEASNDSGKYFHSITAYPSDYLHGSMPLNRFEDAHAGILGLVAKDNALHGKDPRRAVFIDTETTGLAGGAGTVPFLIGLGFFSDDGFRVEQFFMRDFHEERAILQAVAEKMIQAEFIVSYNGKAYDLNILESRYTLSRMRNRALDLPHLDLLFTARRLWRRRLQDCSLANIERRILEFYREGDVPGALIPQIYFDYVRLRDAQRLRAVFRHNRWDVVTLAAIAGIAARIYSRPVEQLNDPLDLMSLGRNFWNMGLLTEAAACFRSALDYAMDPTDRMEVLEQFGFVLKRKGDWASAVKVWECMLDSSRHTTLPYEELAKYYDHRMRNIEKAAEIVLRALDRIRLFEEIRPGVNCSADRRDLEYRLSRLRRKQGSG